MTTFEDFAKTFLDAQNDLKRDYQTEDGMPDLCEILHREVGLDQTQLNDAEERAALAQKNGVDVDPDSIKLTEEHTKLHGLLNTVQREAMVAGITAGEALAIMYAIGRRSGLKEAASMFDGNLDGWNS